MEEQESSNSFLMATITSRQGSPSHICHDDVLQSFPPSSSSNKRTAHNGKQDRISALPDPLIQHILSYLTVKDVLKTSILSKRWRSVWTAVPRLDFYVRWYHPVHQFVSFVEKTLNLFTGGKVEKFNLPFGYNESFSLQVDNWVRFAVERNVEELVLHFCDALGSIYCEPYPLPQCIYSISSLQILNTRFCNLQPIGHVSWTSLRVLSIGYAKLSDQIIAEVLSGSPKLELLRLQYCGGISRMVVSSPNLKELVIDGFWDSVGAYFSGGMEISAPNVCSISLLGQLYGRKYKFIHMSSLVEVNLNFELIDKNRVNLELLRQGGFPFYRRHSDLLKEILGELLHVQKLTIGTWCLTKLSIRMDLPSPFSNLRSLTVESRFDECDLSAIASLLENSPELEKLIINILPDGNEYNHRSSPRDVIIGSNSWKLREGEYKCLYSHLKTVEINGFQSRFEGINFFCSWIEFLLKTARVLEKLDIHVKSNYFRGSWESWRLKQKVRDFLEVNQLLLSYPRASANCVVLLKNPFN